MESSLLDLTHVGADPLGTTVGGWVDSFSDTVNSWGSWFTGVKPPAQAPVTGMESGGALLGGGAGTSPVRVPTSQTRQSGTMAENEPLLGNHPDDVDMKINEIPEEEYELMGGGEESSSAPWGDDSELPGGEAEELGDLEGIMELEAPPPEFGSQAYIRQLAVREAAQYEEMGIEMQTVELGGAGVESVESGAVLAEEILEGAEIAGEAVEATSAGILGGLATGALGAAAMVGVTIGIQHLLGWNASSRKRMTTRGWATSDTW